MAKRLSSNLLFSNHLSAKQSPFSCSQSRSKTNSDAGPNPIDRTPFSRSAVTPAKSLKSVLLHDWWLIKVEGKGLGVEGFETKGRPGVRLFASAAISKRCDSAIRLFSSAAISKRRDSATLETVDGITVTLGGLINWSRTQQNGFNLEVCNHFLLGFPYYWEDYATPSHGEESVDRNVPTGKTGPPEPERPSDGSSNTLFPVSLDDIPTCRVRDFLMSPPRGSDDCCKRKILDDVLGRLKSCANEINPVLNQGNTKDEIPISVDADVYSPRTGVKTRSMTRLNNLRDNQGDASSSKSCRGERLPDTQVLTSEARIRSGENPRKRQKKSLPSKVTSIHDDCTELVKSAAAANQSGGVVTRRAAKRNAER